MSEALAAAALYGLVFVGISITLAIFSWPALLSLAGVPAPAVVAVLCAHVASLVRFDSYLYLNRKALVPLRRPLMPLLSIIVKSEARREREETWFVRCGRGAAAPETADCRSLLAGMSRVVRRDLTKKLAVYKESGVTTLTRHGDFFSLTQFVPLVFYHERRRLRGTDKSVIEEFVKRFLVLFLCTDGYFDLYFDCAGQFCALQFFVQQGNVLQSCVYFCSEKESQSGIWMYTMVRNMLRGALSDSVEYVNFHVHLSYAKRCAGCSPAHYEDEKLLGVLYPLWENIEPEMGVVDLKPDLSGLPGISPSISLGTDSDCSLIDTTTGFSIDKMLSWLLIYAESLMVLLHFWILIGVALPSLGQMAQQDIVTKYGYLISDMMLPLLAIAHSKPQHVPGMLNILITAHTLLYADFIFDGSRLHLVMSWAYSDWSKRMQLEVAPGAAVLLDAACHTGGLVILCRWKSIAGKTTAVALGMLIGSLSICVLQQM